MNHDGDGIASHHMLYRLDPIGLRFGALLFFDLAGSVGHVHRAIDERGNASARPAAGDGDLNLGLDLAVGLCPGQRHVDQRIGALVLDASRCCQGPLSRPPRPLGRKRPV